MNLHPWQSQQGDCRTEEHPFCWSDSERVTDQEWEPNTTAYIHHVGPSLFVQTILSLLRPDPSCQNCHSPLHLDGHQSRRLWNVDVQLPPCLPVFFSNWGLCFKAEMTGAVPLGLIPAAATAEAPTATQSHHHPDECILSWAASRSPNDSQLICRAYTYPIWLPLHHWALYGTVEYNSLHDGQPYLSCLSLFFSDPVSLAWRQAFCLSEYLLKPLMRYLSAG